jgi:hypothetical protein
LTYLPRRYSNRCRLHPIGGTFKLENHALNTVSSQHHPALETMKLAIFALASFLALPSFALIHGVDSSALVPTSTFIRARGQGFVKAVIRGYQEACGSGGRVDPNFLPSYRNAVAAGYTNIDTYWYPCNGSGNKCKPYATQIAELKNTITSNGMKIGRVWIDIEKDAICNPWNYGAAGNIVQARSLIAAAKASGLSIGIYSSASQWTNIFGSTSVVLAPDLPLWFAKFDNVETLRLPVPFGGWRGDVFGHQYTDQSASGLFDLNVFAA